jgi:hypothetical protein
VRTDGGAVLLHPPSKTGASTAIEMRILTRMGRNHRMVGSGGGTSPV